MGFAQYSKLNVHVVIKFKWELLVFSINLISYGHPLGLKWVISDDIKIASSHHVLFR